MSSPSSAVCVSLYVRLYSLISAAHAPNRQAGRVVTEIPSEMQQDVIWSEICASYLDRVVQDFFGPPSRSDAPNAQIAEELDVYNAYFEVIKSSQHVPYFSKFLRVSPYAEKLPQAICDRLLVPEVGPKWTTLFSDPYPLSVAAMVVQVLNTILTSYTKKGTPDNLLKKKTKEDILKLLGIWILQAPSNQDGRFLRTVSERTVRGLTSPQFAKTLANQARRELKNWEVCGLPSCGIKDDRILKACSR